MTRIERIGDRLTTALSPVHLAVLNESGQHAVPPGSETHVRVIVVAPRFDGLGAIARHRLVQSELAEELRSGLHALAIEARTPAEWAAAGHSASLTSPPCQGGSQRDPQAAQHDPNGAQR